MTASITDDTRKWVLRILCGLALGLVALLLGTGGPVGAAPAGAPLDTATPTITPTPPPVRTCGPDANYVVTPSNGHQLVPGTDDTGNHCIYCTTPVNLPFNFTFYGQEYNRAWVSNSGNLQFGSSNPLQ